VTAGWRVIRITWRQLTTDPDEIASQLSALLDREPYAAGGSSRSNSLRTTS
jgi:very-short-patch-repair endonuclease